MADEKDINNQRELNKEQERFNNLAEQLVDIIRTQAGASRDVFQETINISNAQRDQIRYLKYQSAEKQLLRSITTDLTKISANLYGLGEEEIINQRAISRLQGDRIKLQSRIRQLTQQSQELFKQGREEFERGNKAYAQTLIDLANNTEAQIGNANDLVYGIDQQIQKTEELKKSTSSITFGNLEGISKRLGLESLSEAFKEAGDESRKITLDNKKIEEYKKLRREGVNAQQALNQVGLKPGQVKKGIVSPLAGGLKGIGKTLGRAFGPQALFALLIDGIFKADKEVTELAKGMALTKSEASIFRSELAFAANTSADLYVTSTKLVETFSSLNKQFGFITNFSTQTLVAMTKLTERVGIASDAAGNLAASSLINGKSLDENYKSVLATSYQLQRQRGIQFDLRDILSEVGKTTGLVRANLGANPKLISEAVTQARLLGSNLQDVAGAASSFLDFESSIAAELEAELLLGRNINLERARAAALTGDLATVAKEVAKQAGDFGQFTKLNVIQQDALAKSLGFSSDQLADILFQQETQNKSAKELRALGKNDLADRVEQTEAQKDFNALVQKLKGLFVDVGTALVPILDLATNLFKLLEPIFFIIGGIAKGISAVIGGITGGFSGASQSTSQFEKSATNSVKKVAEASKNIGEDISKSIGKGAYHIEEATKKAKEETGGFWDNLYKDKGIKLRKVMTNKEYQEHLENLGTKAKSVVPKIKETAINVRNQAEDKGTEYLYRMDLSLNELKNEMRQNTIFNKRTSEKETKSVISVDTITSGQVDRSFEMN